MADRAGLLKNRLMKNLARLQPWRRREGVTCVRAYDRDIPELPLQVDIYEGEDGLRRAQIVAFAPRHGGGTAFDRELAGLSAVVGDALAVSEAHRFVQVRERERGGAIEADEAASAVDTFIVREGAARFVVRLGARRDPGLFLDHRTTRRLVADEARRRALLNLFAYTGSFSVHAALAGAASTTSVDLSASTARWAEENLERNGVDRGAHRVIAEDVFAFLERDVGTYDVIVLDPPSVSRSRRATRDRDVQRDHPWLIDRCLAHLQPGGSLWFSTNLRTFRLAPLPDHVVVDDVTRRTLPPDFHDNAHRCFRIARR
jgi:23S rRNA G2069 N7-methylase RlmK/C1962 C5-methylase RlmI